MDQLPPELRLIILGYTSMLDIIHFSITCKRNAGIICDDFQKIVDFWHYQNIITYSHNKINKIEFVCLLCEIGKTDVVGIFLDYLQTPINSSKFVQSCFTGNSVETFLYLKNKIDIDWKNLHNSAINASGNKEITDELFKIEGTMYLHGLIRQTISVDDADYLEYIIDHPKMSHIKIEYIWDVVCMCKSINCLIFLTKNKFNDNIHQKYYPQYIVPLFSDNMIKLKTYLESGIIDEETATSIIIDNRKLFDYKFPLDIFYKCFDFSEENLRRIIHAIRPGNAIPFYKKLKEKMHV